jgi:hypothetical protein
VPHARPGRVFINGPLDFDAMFATYGDITNNPPAPPAPRFHIGQPITQNECLSPLCFHAT